ncbi:type II toxin-antitoxin system HicB family antitoxin [Candidatus Gottesmanbacteria bacterium]|nr:type II toxin-antitoxin system HicB family antitoxin [Candidatus Gottesmanbacteria bacterium]
MKKQKKLTIFEYELPIIVEGDSGGFVAKCPNWKDCYAQGETLEETINEISYTASSLIELYKEENITIPLKLRSKKNEPSPFFRFNFPLIVSG